MLFIQQLLDEHSLQSKGRHRLVRRLRLEPGYSSNLAVLHKWVRIQVMFSNSGGNKNHDD